MNTTKTHSVKTIYLLPGLQRSCRRKNGFHRSLPPADTASSMSCPSRWERRRRRSGHLATRRWLKLFSVARSRFESDKRDMSNHLGLIHADSMSLCAKQCCVRCSEAEHFTSWPPVNQLSTRIRTYCNQKTKEPLITHKTVSKLALQSQQCRGSAFKACVCEAPLGEPTWFGGPGPNN